MVDSLLELYFVLYGDSLKVDGNNNSDFNFLLLMFQSLFTQKDN
ncbi:hypothetical protein SODG_005618 [Sodalis praecaptivus]|nr:hypothetical protein NVIRENTERO_04104 [Sodalis praecaptivus]